MKTKFFSAILLNLILCSCSIAGDWYTGRGCAEGKAVLEYNGDKKLDEWHYIYKNNRRYKPGLAVWASPALAVVGGHPMAFIGGYDQTLHALDLAEKNVVWRKITNGEISSAPAVAKIEGTDIVFWGSADRTVYAHSAFSGRKLWTKELIEPSSTLGQIFISSPYIHNAKLYISCFAYDKSLSRNEQKGYLFCLDTKTGRILLRLQVSTGILTDPIGFSLDGKSYVAVCARRGLLQCFDVTSETPRKVWQYQMPHETLGSPVVTTQTDPPMIYLGSKYGNFVAINAYTGQQVWQEMAGNWIDNSAATGEIGGKKVAFVGSHDYCVYAYDAQTGGLIWKKPIGGEVFSAPTFFKIGGVSYLCVASLDNHLYVLDAQTGTIFNSYFTGNPIWDKLPKGEYLWGSPATVLSGADTCIVYGSFNDMVYSIPVMKACSLTAMARSVKSLWVSLGAVLFIFCAVVMPIFLKIPLKQTAN